MSCERFELVASSVRGFWRLTHSCFSCSFERRFGTKPIELVLFIVVLVRIVTVGYVLVRYLLNENKLGLLSLLFLGAVFVGPSGYGWCNGDLYSIPPGKMLAYSFLAFSCMVVFGTFFTGAPGLLSFGLNAQILLR